MTRRFPPPTAALDLRLAPGVLVRDRGRLLCGGSPFRVLRLSDAGARVVAAWAAGGPVGPQPAQAGLARRLLDAGLLVSGSTPAADPPGAVVVPVRDRVPELTRCLAALARLHPDATLVVVDDGSRAQDAVAAVAGHHGAVLIRHGRSRGPAAARNTGLRATTSPLIAFVDSDVVVGATTLARLASHFADPAVGAAAPRVLPLDPGRTRLARYEAARSGLDMGSLPASVGPGRPVAHVPSATLVVRRVAVGDGFDETLEVGEDVDLIWRMAADGWRVAYDPEATVLHDHRVRAAAFWRRRFEYATSIGPLAARHPAALPALRVEPWSTAIVAALVLGRPRSAVALSALRLARVRRGLRARTGRPSSLAAALVGRQLLWTARGIGHATRRTWSPALVPAATHSNGARRLLLAAVALGWLDYRRTAAPDFPLALADDVVAALGTWTGCVRSRALAPLVPKVRIGQGRKRG